MREEEAKLAVGDSFTVPDLAAIVPGGVVRPRPERRIDDTYYDTDDLRLLRWGCTLRHRKRKGWTVKLPVSRSGHALVRDEIDFGGRAGRPPAEALTVVAPFTRGRALLVIATLATERTSRSLLDADGRTLVEVVDDRVRCIATDGREVSFRQVEIELAPGADPAIIDDVHRRLVAAGAEPEPGGIKVLRALGERAAGRPDVVVPPLGDDPTARAVIRAAIARSVAQLITELPAAQVGTDPEGVHQARVATRRLRSDLQTFEPLLEAGWGPQLQDDLRPLARHLGLVRDADVLLERFRTALGDHTEIDRQQAQPALALLEDQRRAARDELGTYLRAGAIDAVLDRLVAAAADPPTTAKADRPATGRLPVLVRRRWRELDEAVGRLGPDPSPSALHEVRILTKRTRYAAEAVSVVFGRPARDFARSLAAVQDILGERNDAAVAEDWLATNARHLAPTAAFAAGRLAQLMHRDAAVGPRPWTRPYRKAARRRNRRWFD